MDDIKKKYLEFDQSFRLRRSILGCILTIIFMPAGASVDYFLYPDFLSSFWKIRVGCSLLILLILTLHRFELGKKYVRVLTMTWLVLVPATLCWMIFVTDRYASTYYAGLSVFIFSVAVILPLSTREMLAFCLTTIGLYVLASADFSLGNANILFFNNLYFIALTSVISTIAIHLNSKLRFKEFALNQQLKDTLQTLRSTQSKLIHSEKINAIGNLSAGLLHEVNNPLNYTMTALHVMKMNPLVRTDEDLKDTMKDMEEGMNRIKTIVTDLRAFAYPEEADKQQHFSVQKVVESAVRFTASETKEIEKNINIPEGLMVMASQTHIVQVLINLISNAARAISKTDRKGLITIEAKPENDRITISVADNGTGMSEAILGRIFEPFFTTNEVGKGTGLGLSVSHTIVKNHGGNLLATSKLGEGSKFSFDLPIG